MDIIDMTGSEKLPRHLRLFGVPVLWNPFPIASMTSSSMAIALGWPVYGRECPWIVHKVHNINRRASDIRHWIYYRFHPRHRYNVVPTGLKPGYYDYDKRMLHACISLLMQYIKEEGGADEIQKHIDNMRNNPEPWGTDDLSAHIEPLEAFLKIYRWWTEERPAEKEYWEELLDLAFGNGRRTFESIPEVDETGEVAFYKLKRIECTEEEQATRDSVWELEKKMEDDDQSNLELLVKYRRHLWS